MQHIPDNIGSSQTSTRDHNRMRGSLGLWRFTQPLRLGCEIFKKIWQLLKVPYLCPRRRIFDGIG